MIHFDREKYIGIMRSQGVNAALTVLHEDVEKWEVDTFEGVEGYQSEMWNDLLEIREFSRELWQLALKPQRSTSLNE